MGAVWWKRILVRHLNTCQESRRTKLIAGAWTKEDSWRSCSRPPVKYLKTTSSQPKLPTPVEIPTDPPRKPDETVPEDLDIGMDPIEPIDPSEGAGAAASSTEIEVQSSPWKGLGASFGQHALHETPFAEAAGSPRLPKALLEKPLEDELEENVEDETGLIGPADVLRTKSQGAPSSSTASSFLEKRQYDREISFNQLPVGDVPLYQEAERVQWDEWVTHGSVKIHPPVEAEKVRQQVARERRLHSRFCVQEQERWSVGSFRRPHARESQGTIGDPASALSGQCPGFGENGCSNSASDRGECLPHSRGLYGLVSES